VTSTATPIDNGVNVDFLLTAREALAEQPEGAAFAWRVSNTWVKGTHSKSTVRSFFGLGQEQAHRSEFEFGRDSSTGLNGLDQDTTRRRKPDAQE
jgi:hypothetical protein